MENELTNGLVVGHAYSVTSIKQVAFLMRILFYTAAEDANYLYLMDLSEQNVRLSRRRTSVQWSPPVEDSFSFSFR